MDTARQFIPMAPVCTVTADQVVHDFQGDIPAGVKFRCPSCDRPVQFHRGSRASTTSADASGDQAPAVRRNPRSHSSRSVHRTVRPHFRHAKNDPVARFCERYQAGLGADPRIIVPSLPMFLRKDRNRAGSGHHAQSTPTFHLEISVRRRSLGHDLISELRYTHCRRDLPQSFRSCVRPQIHHSPGESLLRITCTHFRPGTVAEECGQSRRRRTGVHLHLGIRPEWRP